MKKLFLLLSLSALLFSCSTQENELIAPEPELNGLFDSEMIYVNPDGSNVMAAAGTPIYAKLVSSTTIHFFWDSACTQRAALAYDIVLRYKLARIDISVYEPLDTFARVVTAGSISVELPFQPLYGTPSVPPPPMKYKYVLTGIEEFSGTVIKGGLFQQIVNGRMYFYTNNSLTNQAYLPGNVVVTYGIMETTHTNEGIFSELTTISQWIVPQWCEGFALPMLKSEIGFGPDSPRIIREYFIFSCVWQ